MSINLRSVLSTCSVLLWIVACGALVGKASKSPAAEVQLRVSENRRFLVHADGKPFFYLGDTAWELFHRLNRENATRYLDDRARIGRRAADARGT